MIWHLSNLLQELFELGIGYVKKIVTNPRFIRKDYQRDIVVGFVLKCHLIIHYLMFGNTSYPHATLALVIDRSRNVEDSCATPIVIIL
ncbi:MAG: hypothetical protein EZS28_055737 [Streblomastix strix]|uniref:Uncharacterized protein n=1 Tax=Streblomastix strix TaxID=222440 RepID=A0A5J4PV80_9EUKA|nr:MAG: hypothetical protein EZS28_055737 [Streblomastix strix]